MNEGVHCFADLTILVCKAANLTLNPDVSLEHGFPQHTARVLAGNEG